MAATLKKMLWGGKPKDEGSAHVKLAKLYGFVCQEGPGMAAHVKELCDELQEHCDRLERCLGEEKDSVSSLECQVKELGLEMVEEEMKTTAAEIECDSLQKQVAVQRSEMQAQVSELRTALTRSEECLEKEQDRMCKLLQGPHHTPFSEKASCIPRLGVWATVLDANYRQSCALLSSQPFTAEAEAAAATVEAETLEDRKLVADPQEHAVLLQALEPVGGCSLPSLEQLRAVLAEQRDTIPEFFAAIGGEQLHEQLGQMLQRYCGPHREEDEYLRGVVRDYVVQVIQRLYQNSRQAACDIQERRQLEDKMARGIRDISQELTKQFLEDRGETEKKRSNRVEELLRFYLEKLRAVTDNRHEEVLASSSKDFEAFNAKALERYDAAAEREQAHATEQRERKQALQAYIRQKQKAAREARATANWTRLASGARLEDEAAALKARFDAILGVMEDAREASVVEDRARRELERGLVVEEEASAAQERIAQQHDDLVAHYGECRQLLSDFAAFVRQGYGGLRAKAEVDARALVHDLPLDRQKVAALSRAHEEDLDRQRQMTLAVFRETDEERRTMEKQLRVLEMKRNREGKDFGRLKADWEQANNDLKALSEDVNAIDHQKARCSEVHEAYAAEFGKAGVAHDPAFQGDEWASGFLFNDREDESFQPAQRMLLYSPSEKPMDTATVQSFEVVGGGGAISFRDEAGGADDASASAPEPQLEVGVGGGGAPCLGGSDAQPAELLSAEGQELEAVKAQESDEEAGPRGAGAAALGSATAPALTREGAGGAADGDSAQEASQAAQASEGGAGAPLGKPQEEAGEAAIQLEGDDDLGQQGGASEVLSASWVEEGWPVVAPGESQKGVGGAAPDSSEAGSDATRETGSTQSGAAAGGVGTELEAALAEELSPTVRSGVQSDAPSKHKQRRTRRRG